MNPLIRGDRETVMPAKTLWGSLLAALLLGACAVNPVTGERNLGLVSAPQEIQMGAQSYVPARQMQGGDYVADPSVAEYVSRVGQRLAAVSDRDLPYEFSVINSSVPNAWAMPGGKIAVNRGLLVELESEAELAAVLAHEIVHAAARHSAQGIERDILLQGAVLAAGIAAASSGLQDLAMGGARVAAELTSKKYGRDAEREADRFGMDYMIRAGYDPQAAVSLQETFLRLSEGNRQDWLTGLFASHPPSQERVLANRAHAQALPPGGEVGRETYQARMAVLQRTRGAYEAHDRGRKALTEGDAARAEALAREALAVEPREALFHGLLGNALAEQGRRSEALASYDRALARDDGFFHYYLHRGLLHQKMGNAAAAEVDLQKSLTLFPTAPAFASLGDLALQAGNRAQAVDYYRKAAKSDSEAGKRAAAALARLELESNPGAYLKLEAGVDRGGYLVARVTNTTPVPVRDVRLVVRYPDAAGRTRQEGRAVPGVLGAGQAVEVPLGVGPVKSREQVRGVQVEVVSARLAENR